MNNDSKPSLLQRAAEATQYVISGVKPSDWMSPLQPLMPNVPQVVGRKWDFQVGRNINYTPRSQEQYSFAQLRAIAMNCELLRLAIETRKDQMEGMTWQIRAKEEGADENDKRIVTLTKFFEQPDKINDFPAWLRIILEEVMTTDAVSIYRRRTKGGGLYSLEPIDGATIFPLIDSSGRIPLPPSPAYQQILKGVPKVDYTIDNLIYSPRNPRVFTVYGFSPTEQVVVSAFTEIERQRFQRTYFTAGSTPDTYATMPEGMTMEQIKAYEDTLNGLLAGNLEARRQIPMMPHGTDIKQIKAPPLKDEFDEWLARKICFAFSLPPTAFIKQNNRATANSEKDRAAEEGLEPLKLWVARIINRVIREDFKINDLEFAWNDEKEQDLKEAADIDTELVKAGIISVNEVRQVRGLPPVDGGDQCSLATATGYVPINKPIPEPIDPSDAQQNDAPAEGKSNKVAPKDDKKAEKRSATIIPLKKKIRNLYHSHPSHSTAQH